MSELRAGQTIAGKYRLNKLLGTGGMAAVWSATNMFTEREFAIKFLLPQVAKTPEAARRFLMEAKVSARVNHPNIIEIIDVGQSEDGTLFLVMELLNGVSLESALRRTNPPMSVYELIGIMLDVARALYAAHSAGVIHRDLKPTNIFLHRDRDNVAVPKLLDFGVSKFLLEEDRNQALTVAGTVLGSPLYMSPEQAMGQAQIDGRTDIFAFGAILFEGLTGFRCYDAPNFNALIVTIATTQPKSIDQAAPHLPAELRQIVKDCLVTDRNKRISSFATIIERLNALLPELEKSPLRLPPPLQPGPAPDPDDTNAMPALVKPSDRPPPPPPAENAASPATGFSVGPTSRRTPRSSGVPVGLILGAIVVALAVVGIAGGLIYVSNHPQVTAAPTPAATPVHTQQVSTAASATTIELPDPPVVDISALPSAQKKPTNAPLGKGKLSVDMAGGWCTVKIDNQEVGPTPLADHELSAGQHLVSCTPDGGKTKKEIVFIIAGETKRLKFQ